jgi:hypothetical protein
MTLRELAEQVRIIKDNHLAHMSQDIDRIETKVDKMDARLWYVLIILVGAVVLPALSNLI